MKTNTFNAFALTCLLIVIASLLPGCFVNLGQYEVNECTMAGELTEEDCLNTCDPGSTGAACVIPLSMMSSDDHAWSCVHVVALGRSFGSMLPEEHRGLCTDKTMKVIWLPAKK
jgi:hypothetical protein